ncbi:MAG TPA: hypothetical protein VIF62_34290 [Labilithrix sp.]
MDTPVAFAAALEMLGDARDAIVTSLAGGAAACVVLAYAADVRADVLAVADDSSAASSLALVAVGVAQAAIAIAVRRYSGTLFPLADSASR